MGSMYYFLQMYVNLQLSQKKKFNWKGKPVIINQKENTDKNKSRIIEMNKIAYFYPEVVLKA